MNRPLKKGCLAPFEEQLDRPVLFVQPDNGPGIQVASIAHKPESLAGFMNLVANHAQRLAHLVQQNA